MDVWSHDRADHLERLKRLDGMKEKNKATGRVWKVMGNLRFPLDKTYHGCPYLFIYSKGINSYFGDTSL
jgi:hypothetical protein